MKTFLITLAAIAAYHIILKLALKALRSFNDWLKSESPVETESASMSFKDRLEKKKQEKDDIMKRRFGEEWFIFCTTDEFYEARDILKRNGYREARPLQELGNHDGIFVTPDKSGEFVGIFSPYNYDPKMMLYPFSEFKDRAPK